MRYYRVYDLDNNGYVVVSASNEPEAVEKASLYETGRLEVIETTSCDYMRNLFTVI
jgi:hypothetical protein